jgi:cytidine deaminase
MIERRTFLFGVASSLVAAALPKRAQAQAALPAARLSAKEAADLAKSDNVTVDALMTRLLPEAQKFSHAPVSNFHVGAVVRGFSEALYLGANLEFPGNALNQTVHAEQAAIANAYANGETGIRAIAVTAAPCGHCRQFMNEIADGDRIKIHFEGQPTRALAELLPIAFGPRDLRLATPMFSNRPLQLQLLSKKSDALTQAALAAATRAYAPYSQSPSGVAVAMASGKMFAGSYLENAAFNPSLSPLQSVLVGVALGGEDFPKIRRVVLVEKKGAAISQRASTESVLRAIAPGASLEVQLAS